MRPVKKLTLAAMLCGLSMVLLYLGSLFELFDISMVAIASLFVVFAHIELGHPYQWLVYAATATLAWILIPDKFAALLYTLAGGLYPILKAYAERLPRLFSAAVKALCFAGIYALSMLLIRRLGLLPTQAGRALSILYILFCAVCFAAYDLMLSTCIYIYMTRLRRRFRRLLK